MSEKVDKVLSGIIIILIIVVVWKWFQSSSSCDNKVLPCGCKMGQCACAQISRQMPQRQMPQRQMPQRQMSYGSGFEGSNKQVGKIDAPTELNNAGTPVDDDIEAIKKSHDEYQKGNGFNGLAQGSSSNTVLEETGRSYGTSNFVGLTARKFCKAREMARPAPESRVVPSQAIEEACHVDIYDMV
jgi:hypothetical protein